ncbi:MAG: hypothetical protein MK102_18085 [Fuerstiella sp.]|nr:hypothetical protein [Fuerstiella sp.]
MAVRTQHGRPKRWGAEGAGCRSSGHKDVDLAEVCRAAKPKRVHQNSGGLAHFREWFSFVSAVSKAVSAFIGRELIDELSEALAEGLGGAFNRFSQQGFQLRKRQLDRIEVPAMRSQVTQVALGRLAGLAHPNGCGCSGCL